MSEQSNTISTDQLQIGVYVYLDVGWINHPFSFNNFKIKTDEQLATIRSLGLKKVRWDPARSDMKPLPANTAKVMPIGAQAAAAADKESAAALAAANAANIADVANAADIALLENTVAGAEEIAVGYTSPGGADAAAAESAEELDPATIAANKAAMEQKRERSERL